MKYYEDKEYQEMCEGADELRKLWKPKLGDWVGSGIQLTRRKDCSRNPRVVQFVDEKGIITSRYRNGSTDRKHKIEVFPIFSQEDLQEMVGKEEIHIKYEPGNRYNPLYPWGLWTWSEGEDKMGTYRVLVKSPYAHQLWLTIVMRKLYKKKEWDPMKKLWEKE